MAHTNQTAHYHLPQYVGTDIINPLTDTNGAYEAIDTAIYEVGQTASGMSSDIDALKIQNGDSALDTTAQTLSGAVNELKSGADALGLRVTANETDISTLQTQMSTATGNITTLNTSVAGLQTEVASKASATALNNLTVKVGTGNLDTVAQNCVDAINEVKAAIPSGGGSASSVSYDGTTSGLSATNVQDAIDEVKADIPTSFGADDVTYDNTDSGLTATDVQSAIDEIVELIPDASTPITVNASNKTWATIASELESALTTAGVTLSNNAYIVVTRTSGDKLIYRNTFDASNYCVFTYCNATVNGVQCNHIDITAHTAIEVTILANGTTVTNVSAQTATNVDKVELYA